jgi:hypothetical protein
MEFRIIGRIAEVEVIATGTAIRKRKRLWRLYGKGRRRKLKGIATVEFPDGRYRMRKVTGTKPIGSARKTTRSNGSLTDMKNAAQFAVCISNKGYAASLEVRKIYRLIPDKAGAKHGLVRVVDELGEDYLFPEECFVSLRLPQAAERAVLRASP